MLLYHSFRLNSRRFRPTSNQELGETALMLQHSIVGLLLGLLLVRYHEA